MKINFNKVQVSIVFGKLHRDFHLCTEVGIGSRSTRPRKFARSFFEGFIEDLFLLFIRSPVPRERSFKSFFFILVPRDIRLCSSIRTYRMSSGFHKIITMSTPTHHYNVRLIWTRRGMDIPVINNCLFVAKDNVRCRYRCKTWTCNAPILIRMGAGGTYYEQPPLHNRLPHDELIKDVEYKNSTKMLATAAGNRSVATRTIASDVRENDASTRRLSSDIRFVRRARQCNRAPTSPMDITFDDESARFLLYKSVNNGVIVFGDIATIENATHVSHVSIDGTFSRCPKNTTPTAGVPAVCWNGHAFPFAFALLPNKRHTKRHSMKSTRSSEDHVIARFSTGRSDCSLPL